MLVYGDHHSIADPRQRLHALGRELESIASMPPAIDRHAALVGALIEAGTLQQGVEDAGIISDALAAFTCGLSVAVLRSWDSGYAALGELPTLPTDELPRSVELRLPEGFAFYALYPEQYAVAARKLRLMGVPRVIGIRSIGTTLGAMVAAALGAAPPVTVRPFGDPFARKVELPPSVIEKDAHYVIVDEGPGLSGSSFGAVADWLEGHGVPLERIAFLPSHGGELGARASEAHRSRWSRAQRESATFDSAFLSARFGDLTPFARGGPWQRLKFRAELGGKRVLLKFAGLGKIAAGKLEMARALHANGLAPEPLGLVHGFLVERWVSGAHPLARDDTPVEQIGRYIGRRAELFPAPDASGASLAELLEMTRRNVALALGEEAALQLQRWDVEPMQSRVRRVRTDNKLDRHEWLRTTGGGLIKTDALDHHQGHDLIGCQDPAWDLAGAIVEFDLGEDEARRLIAASGLPADAGLLDFYRVAYPAFRLGRQVLATEMAGSTPAAGERHDRLVHLLQRRIGRRTRHESLVD